MLFTVPPFGSGPPTGGTGRAVLRRHSWDDWFKFETQFLLVVFDVDGTRHTAGSVKIGQFGLLPSRTPAPGMRCPELPDEFDALDARFFSLGQDENYYETLNKVSEPLRRRVVAALRDVAADSDLFDRALGEPVMTESLLRTVQPDTVRGKFRRLVRGDEKQTPYNFAYTLPQGESEVPLELDFNVAPRAQPPTNIHVLIGRNGVGKTRCLQHMTRALVKEPPHDTDYGEFAANTSTADPLFANLVSVTFSAFDEFAPIEGTRRIRYNYIGLQSTDEETDPVALDGSGRARSRKLETPKTPSDLTTEFVMSVAKCRVGVRCARWHRALRSLEADPLFREANVTELADEAIEGEVVNDRAARTFKRLSSGHKIVLLTITRLVQTVAERTLVLLDEPEAHLHPPLLSAFIRSLSDLLIQRNGVALIATHSPVVLQEAPRSCVWVLRRTGAEVRAERPRIETFGENVGVLTREVFGLEVTHSGFHRLITAAVARRGSYEGAVDEFDGQLGAEARAIARGMVVNGGAPDPDDEG